MLESGLEDIKNLLDQEEDKDEDKEEDLQVDTVEAKYLRMVNTFSFSEMCNYTIEFPASKHNTPEVKAAKRNEIRNLKDYDTFEEVKEEGQETIGSQWAMTEK